MMHPFLWVVSCQKVSRCPLASAFFTISQDGVEFALELVQFGLKLPKSAKLFLPYLSISIHIRQAQFSTISSPPGFSWCIAEGLLLASVCIDLSREYAPPHHLFLIIFCKSDFPLCQPQRNHAYEINRKCFFCAWLFFGRWWNASLTHLTASIKPSTNYEPQDQFPCA